MTILWLTSTAVIGGAERATLVLARHLVRRGHRVEVLCDAHGALAAAAAAAGASVRRDRAGPRRLARALRAAAPDAVLVTTIGDWAPACLAAPRTGQRRLVLVRHMALPVSWPLRWLADRRADAVVAVSDAVRVQLLGRLGVRPSRLHLIHNPTRFAVRATVPSPAERAAARRRLGLATGSAWVAYLGGWVPAKGPRDALAAVRRADAGRGVVRLLAAGPRRGHGSPWGEGSGVRDLGFIEAVDDLLLAADALLVPTQRSLSEAMPLAVIEAMACGTPVIAAAVGGIPEALGADGACGRLVAPDDPAPLGAALIDLLADPQRAAQMASRALARAGALFDPERIADAYEALLTPPRR